MIILETYYMTKKEKIGVITVIVVLILLLIGISAWVAKMRYDTSKKVDLIEHLNDELTTITIRDSLKGKEIRVLEDVNTKMFLNMSTTNTTLKALQNEIRRVEKKLDKGSSVTVIASSSEYNMLDSSLNTVSNISASMDSLMRKFNQYPVYTDTITGFKGWITGTVKIGHNFTDLLISTRDTMAITIGINKRPKGIKNLFKPKEPYADVHSYNPYSEVTDFRTFRVALPRKKHWVVGGGLFGGVGGMQPFSAGNGAIGYGGGVGIFVGYKLFEF